LVTTIVRHQWANRCRDRWSRHHPSCRRGALGRTFGAPMNRRTVLSTTVAALLAAPLAEGAARSESSHDRLVPTPPEPV